MIEENEEHLRIGKAYLFGVGAGFVGGSLISAAQNYGEHTAIQLNEILNNGIHSGERLGFVVAMPVAAHELVISHTKRMDPIVSHALAGGAAGGTLGLMRGWKEGLALGITGASLGALYGYYMKS